MSDTMYSLEDPSIQNRINEVLSLFGSFLEKAQTKRETTRFLSVHDFGQIHPRILLDLFHGLSSNVYEYMLEGKRQSEQQEAMQEWAQYKDRDVNRMRIKEFTPQEIETLTSIARALLRRYATAAKPGNRYSYIKMASGVRHDLRCTTSSSTMLNDSRPCNKLRRTIGPIIDAYMTDELWEKIIYLGVFCQYAPVVDTSKKPWFDKLQTYIEEWNSGTFPVKISRYEPVYYSSCNYTCPEYTIGRSGMVLHIDRRPEQYILDGENIYTYGVFRDQMEVDLWKIVWDKPEEWITPANCHLISTGQLQVVDVTDVVIPEVRDRSIVALQFRKGDNQVISDSKLVFYQHRKGSYKVLDSTHPQVKRAVEKVALLKQLTR